MSNYFCNKNFIAAAIFTVLFSTYRTFLFDKKVQAAMQTPAGSIRIDLRQHINCILMLTVSKKAHSYNVEYFPLQQFQQINFK